MVKINKDIIYLTIIVTLIAGIAQLYFSFNVQPILESNQAREVSIYYSYDTKGNELIIDEIRKAEKFVYFAIYTFTRSDIKDALLSAKYNGLEVVGLMDKEQTDSIEQQRDIAKELHAAGIPVSYDDHTAIMHLKVLVTDKSYVTGSFNWTTSATDKNDEVLEIGRDETIRKQYQNLVQDLFAKYPVN